MAGTGRVRAMEDGVVRHMAHGSGGDGCVKESLGGRHGAVVGHSFSGSSVGG